MSSNFFRGLVCVLGCALVPGAWAGSSQAPQTPLWMALVDAIAKKTLDRPVLGISIALANNDRVVFARGYGFADLARTVPVTSDTVFNTVSISKNIAAGVLLQLAEQGRLSLDDDVIRYVPNAPVHGQKVTVRQLLNHTSGIHNLASLPDAGKNEQVLALMENAPLDFTPGTSWRYSDSGFYLAQLIAENVSRQPYAALLRDRVFAPLQMHASSLCVESTPVPNLAAGSEVLNGKLGPIPESGGKPPFAGGDVCSTASDLLRWQIALNKNRVVSKHSLELMRTPTVLADGASIDYGLGTRMGQLEGHRVFGHTGSGQGFITVLETFPEDRLSIAVLINTDAEGAATDVADAIALALLGFTPIPARDLPVPANELGSIPGTYDSVDGLLKVFAENGKLHFQMAGTPGATGAITRRGTYSYAIDENRRIRFFYAPGKSRWAQIYSAGMMIDAKSAPPAPSPE